MRSQEELLDSTEHTKQKTKNYYENRAIIYVVCMLGGGLIYATFLSKPVYNILIDTVLNTIIAIATAIPLEAYRKYRRAKKNKKKGIEMKDDPLWFHVIESALSLLILILFLSFILVK